MAVNRPGRGWWRSSTLRFAALVFALQVGASSLILLAVHQRTSSELTAIARAEASELRDDLTTAFGMGQRPAMLALVHSRIRGPGHDQAVILLTDPTGRPIAGNISTLPLSLPADGRWRPITLYRLNADDPERMIASVTILADGSRLFTGHVVENSMQLGAVVEEAMIGVLLLSLPLAALGAWLAARMVSQRVAAIATTVDEVAKGNLSGRTLLDGSGDAFERLARGINAMLDRIEALVGELRLVTDGLAHDLRSPLMRIRVATDRAVAATDDPGTLLALQSLSTEADALLAMLTTAMQISEAEAGIGKARFTHFDAAEMMRDIAELYAPLAEDQGYTLVLAPMQPVPIIAHHELLGQAIANLIDNALKYARPGTVTLSASMLNNGTKLTVTDCGPGIAKEQQQQALRRFGRLDPSRHLVGAGLGLSLVAAVCHLHDGRLTMSTSTSSFSVNLFIPKL